MRFDEPQVAGPQKTMMLSAMKEYFDLSPEQIKKYVTPFSEIFMENNCTGSNLDVYCSCGWSGTLPHGKDSSFYTNFRCPKCRQTSKIQKINGFEFDFGTPSTLMITHSKDVVYLEKANLPNDAILIRYFTVYYLPTTNIGKKTINQQIYEYQRIFVTENETFIFNKNALAPTGNGKEWCLVREPLPNRNAWCFQPESQKDSYNAKFFAKAKKSEYSGHVCDFVNMTGMKVEETMRLIEEVSKTFGISRENAARMLYKYVSEYEKIGIEPSFANIEHIDRDTCYAKTISNLFSKDSWYYEMRDCFFEKEVTDSITPVGCNLVDIRCRTEFPRILYNNREKEFVQRFFSEIVDIYTVFPDLYEEGAIQTVNLVMKDNVLKSIVVLAYGEISETKDGKEVIHKAEYTS